MSRRNENKSDKKSETKKFTGNKQYRRNNSKDTKKRDSEKPIYEEDKDEVANPNPTSNDPEFYTSNPVLIDQSARLSIVLKTGAPINVMDWKHVLSGYGYHNTDKWYRPGICVLKLVPSFGNQTKDTSSLNIAASAIYTLIRTKISGARRYSPASIVKLIMAAGQVIAMVNWFQRAFGLMAHFNYANDYLNKYLVEASGFDYEDMKRIGRVNMASRFNYALRGIGNIILPKNISYFNREATVYSGIYVDGPDIRDQMYLARPDGFYIANPNITESHPTTTLDYRSVPDKMKFDEYLEMLDEAIGAITRASRDASSDIFGDILKTYGDAGIYTFNELNESIITLPLYDYNMLMQFKNAIIVPTEGSYNFPSLTEDPTTSTLIFEPFYGGAETFNTYSKANFLTELDRTYPMVVKPMINTTEIMVTPKLVVEYTRLVPAFTDQHVTYSDQPSTGSGYTMTYSARMNAGSEFVNDVILYRFVDTQTGDHQISEEHVTHGLVEDLSHSNTGHDETLILTQFPFAPNVVIGRVECPTWKHPSVRQAEFIPTSYIHNIDNLATIDHESMNQINDVVWNNIVAETYISLNV